ncbi:thiol:disulfide interchange protein DsbA/DsbL [Cognatilysobacter lacus]|uniref:Thiol:disulfide interchange protein DsbA n=1 Tax=Cognatilysobacter lacus TaxID=1643323 RepID=A0A5D8YE06_9GAMM|nr:thiol:disulfide interchange protein DsbA/DsbL [Lysobacter lacus]TZF80670.1 thiol:disulfide interchange protein DsbA/DsbL [Lysobacter lacus]
MTYRPALLVLAVAGLLALSGCEKVPPKVAPAPVQTPAGTASPAASPGGLVPGKDYVDIANGMPFSPETGKIEVVEVFGYTCPHCAHFEPMLEAWKAKQQPDVNLVLVPAPFGGWWQPFAKAYHAADEMGLVQSTHAALFNALHVDHALPTPPAIATDKQVAGFYGQHGANAAEFEKRMNSAGVAQKLKRDAAFLERSGADSTPTLIVDGKYRVIGQSPEDTLRIVDALVARERAAH